MSPGRPAPLFVDNDADDIYDREEQEQIWAINVHFPIGIPIEVNVNCPDLILLSLMKSTRGISILLYPRSLKFFKTFKINSIIFKL